MPVTAWIARMAVRAAETKSGGVGEEMVGRGLPSEAALLKFAVWMGIAFSLACAKIACSAYG